MQSCRYELAGLDKILGHRKVYEAEGAAHLHEGVIGLSEGRTFIQIGS